LIFQDSISSKTEPPNIIILSSTEDIDSVKRANAKGVSGYLLKPAKRYILHDTIQKCLQTKKAA
ncbi:MAG: hypothetical protein OEZ47_17700, partial [Gammaproteobacteria bacterium]|nr:hypothetical protein [Gammaproteobacteria bacterium]